MWWRERRPEIVEDFDREVYGRVPNHAPKVRWEVTATERHKVGDAAAVAKLTALIDGEVAFRQHAGGHTTGPNWATFLRFADRYLGRPGR